MPIVLHSQAQYRVIMEKDLDVAILQGEDHLNNENIANWQVDVLDPQNYSILINLHFVSCFQVVCPPKWLTAYHWNLLYLQ